VKPIQFPEVNGLLAKDQPQYKTLPVYKDPEDPVGEVISCWELTPEETMHVLHTGKIWMRMITFNGQVLPTLLDVKDPWREKDE